MKAAVTSSVMANPGRSSAQACFTGPSFPVASPPPQQLLPCPVLTIAGKGLLCKLHLQLVAASGHHSQDFQEDLIKSSSPIPPPPLCFLLQIEKRFQKLSFYRGENRNIQKLTSPRDIVVQQQIKYMHLARTRWSCLLYILCRGLSRGKPQSQNLCIFQ